MIIKRRHSKMTGKTPQVHICIKQDSPQTL